MGINQCNCLYTKDKHSLIVINNTTQKISLKKAFNLTFEQEEYLKLNEKSIIKIQAIIRGCIVRKKFKCPKITQQKNTSKTNIKESKPIQIIPDYSNPETRAAEIKYGPFKYDPTQNIDQELLDKGPFELDNQAIYSGQWSKNGQRCGKGSQIWPDGSKYDGYWKNDMANGRGRLIHADGNVYEGEWIDDKTNGYGVYTHIDGTRYAGNWYNDLQNGFGLKPGRMVQSTKGCI